MGSTYLTYRGLCVYMGKKNEMAADSSGFLLLTLCVSVFTLVNTAQREDAFVRSAPACTLSTLSSVSVVPSQVESRLGWILFHQPGG